MELPTAPPPLAEPRLDKSQTVSTGAGANHNRGSSSSSTGVAAHTQQHQQHNHYPTQSRSSSANVNDNASTGVNSNAGSFEWQSDRDMELRHCIMQHIVKLLKNQQKVKQSASGNNKKANDEWHAMLPSMVKQLEFSLYKRAKSRKDYMDLDTLKSRLSDLANEIHERTKAARRGSSALEKSKTSIPKSDNHGKRNGHLEASSSNNRQRLVSSSDINPNLAQAKPNEDSKQQLDKDRLRYRQQRLLMLHHSSKCTSDPCDVTKHCAELKLLWKHLEVCPVVNARDKSNATKECDYPHCNSSFLILSHYRNCKVECPVCEPVRKLLRRKKEEAKRLQQQQQRQSSTSHVQDSSRRSSYTAPSASVPSHTPFSSNICAPAISQHDPSSRNITQGMVASSTLLADPSSTSHSRNSFSNNDGFDRSQPPPQASPIVRHHSQSHSLSDPPQTHNAYQSSHHQHLQQQQPHGPNKNNNSVRSHSSTTHSTATSTSSVSQEIENQALRILILRHSIRCQAGSRCHIPACPSFQNLWEHVKNCNDNRCQRKSCYSSRRLLHHYQRCNGSCPMCKLVYKEKDRGNDRALYKVKPLPMEGNLGSNIADKSMSRVSSHNQRHTAIFGNGDSLDPRRKRKLEDGRCMNESSSPQSDDQHTVVKNPRVRTPPSSSTPQLANTSAFHKSTGNMPLTMLSIFSSHQLKAHVNSLHPLKCLTGASISNIAKNIIKRLREEDSSWVFNTPVDAEGLGLTDYHDIIKKPMDYSTIEKWLDAGHYSQLEDFAADFRLVYSNARTYNAEGTIVHVLATTYRDLFEKEYEKGVALATSKSGCDEAVKTGDVCVLCLTSKRTFAPPVYICSGVNCPHVKIRRGNNFYTSFNINFCTQCFSHLPESLEVECRTIIKSQLTKRKNDEVNEEGWVECDTCKHWIHQVCGLFNRRENMDSNSHSLVYTCPQCLLKDTAPPSRSLVARKENSNLHAKTLLRTKLSDYLEKAIFKVIADSKLENIPELCIRQVTSRQCSTLTRDQMLKSYKGYPSEFPFKNKCILMFQKIDGVDILLFALYLYEYGPDCPEPNRNRVYVSYLDSVQYLRPKELRTKIYHEILIQYFDYARRKGFEKAHIWSCPPARGDDYIFYSKPEDQKIPKEARLRKWYQNMLLEAEQRGIVTKTDNLYDLYFGPKTPRDARLVPYLDGDYFIGEAENVLTSLTSKKKGDKSKSNASSGRVSNNSAASAVNVYTDCDEKTEVDLMMAKIGETMHPMKESFFCATLNTIYSDPSKTNKSTTALDSSKKPESEDVLDEDKETLDCEMFNTRQDFLNLCKGNHYQFDQLRRAKHTSMMILWHLHNVDAAKFVQMCTHCQHEISSGTRYHCPVCPDYDLCSECHDTRLKGMAGKCSQGHGLEAIKVQSENTESNGKSSQAAALAARRAQQQHIELHVKLLEHASSCTNECKSRNCPRMKHYLNEYKRCKAKVAAANATANHDGRRKPLSSSCGCKVCKKLRAMISIHAQRCHKKNCPVPDCGLVKEKHRQMIRQQQAMDDRRRMEMNRIYRESDTGTTS